ncbi:BrnT family toxin [Paracraurococcus lichenis]|uniref:BrnT family toxin n=1 Tax=Paracraurococcus lichenis TaxID=3064888 RepID=A0ABT9EAR3_9PROT|nr:BrnT family toxin [Paracraurococcus sp. LOR1-02]MDO9713289.1 BrnT family toxin [Paracraurococcus sp. LOR1-02]
MAGEAFHVGWRLDKAARNLRKHHVGFAEAATVLDDMHACSEPQDEAGEPREKLIGRSSTGRLLAIAVYIEVATGRESAEDIGFIRIISARAATPTEEALYLS